jgi:uncharacterized OB-fold protein
MSPRWFPDAMPTPAVSRETLPWWQAAAEHRLVVQTCAACATPRHPPGPMCPHCRSTDARWQELPGTGTVYSYTVVHQAFLPALAAHLPYIVAVLELDGAPGVRFISNLVDVDANGVHVGLRVELVWDDIAAGYAVPRFRPEPVG